MASPPAAGTARLRGGNGCKMDSRRRRAPPRRPPSPGTSVRLPRRAAPLFRLPRLAFPPGREAAGEGRREPFRYLQPPPATASACGAGPRGGLPAARSSRFIRAARARGAPCPGRRAGDAERADPRAGPGPSAGDGRRRGPRWSRLGRKPAHNEKVGFGLLYFFFVRCIFRNKKKSPTLHTASSASLTTRSSPQRLGGN